MQFETGHVLALVGTPDGVADALRQLGYVSPCVPTAPCVMTPPTSAHPTSAPPLSEPTMWPRNCAIGTKRAVPFLLELLTTSKKTGAPSHRGPDITPLLRQHSRCMTLPTTSGPHRHIPKRQPAHHLSPPDATTAPLLLGRWRSAPRPSTTRLSQNHGHWGMRQGTNPARS